MLESPIKAIVLADILETDFNTLLNIISNFLARNCSEILHIMSVLDSGYSEKMESFEHTVDSWEMMFLLEIWRLGLHQYRTKGSNFAGFGCSLGMKTSCFVEMVFRQKESEVQFKDNKFTDA